MKKRGYFIIIPIGIFLVLLFSFIIFYAPNYTSDITIIGNTNFDIERQYIDNEKNSGYIFVIDESKYDISDYFNENNIFNQEKLNKALEYEPILGQYYFSDKRLLDNSFKKKNGEIPYLSDIGFFSKNCYVASYQYGYMYSYKLKNHAFDYLIYLDEMNQTATVLYECVGTERILYGTNEYVLIYDAVNDCCKYIDISKNVVLYEKELELKMRRQDYIFELDISNALQKIICVNIEKFNNYKTESQIKIYDSISDIPQSHKRQ